MIGKENRASQNAIRQVSYLSRRTTLFVMPRWREMASTEQELETFPDTRVDKVQRMQGVERVDIAPSKALAAARDATAMVFFTRRTCGLSIGRSDLMGEGEKASRNRGMRLFAGRLRRTFFELAWMP